MTSGSADRRGADRLHACITCRWIFDAWRGFETDMSGFRDAAAMRDDLRELERNHNRRAHPETLKKD